MHLSEMYSKMRVLFCFRYVKLLFVNHEAALVFAQTLYNGAKLPEHTEWLANYETRAVADKSLLPLSPGLLSARYHFKVVLVLT